MDFSGLGSRPRLVIGFPGFGMAGSIALQHLIEHTTLRHIGHLSLHDASSMFLAIHDSRPIWPVTVYSDDDRNIVYIHALVPLPGDSSTTADLFKAIDEIDPSRIIVLESIGTTEDAHRTFSYVVHDGAKEGFEVPEPLTEGVVLGTSAEIFSRYPDRTIGIFSEANVAMPDSEAAAQLLEELNSVLGLDLDTNALREMAKVFEEKVKQILKDSKTARSASEQNQMFYVG